MEEHREWKGYSKHGRLRCLEKGGVKVERKSGVRKEKVKIPWEL